MTVTGEEGRDGLSSPRPVVTLALAPAFDYGRFQACLDRTWTRSSRSGPMRLRAQCLLSGSRRRSISRRRALRLVRQVLAEPALGLGERDVLALGVVGDLIAAEAAD